VLAADEEVEGVAAFEDGEVSVPAGVIDEA
jgi:hypothetical protein